MRRAPGPGPAAPAARRPVGTSVIGTAVVGTVLLGAACLAGCSRHPDRQPGSRPSCPPVSGAGFAWPAGVPANLPQPTGARLEGVRRLPSGFTLVTFTAPGSVRAGLLEATGALQAAGYAVGRGSVGTSQARLPFTRDGRPGVLQLTALDACTTRWQLQD